MNLLTSVFLPDELVYDAWKFVVNLLLLDFQSLGVF